MSCVARGCSAVGSASPCQGEGRGFESRHPLEGAVASTPAVEWPSGEATACKAVHTGSIPVSTSEFNPGAISSAGERFPDTEEVTGSIPVSRTSVYADHSLYLGLLHKPPRLNQDNGHAPGAHSEPVPRIWVDAPRRRHRVLAALTGLATGSSIAANAAPASSSQRGVGSRGRARDDPDQLSPASWLGRSLTVAGLTVALLARSVSPSSEWASPNSVCSRRSAWRWRSGSPWRPGRGYPAARGPGAGGAAWLGRATQ